MAGGCIASATWPVRGYFAALSIINKEVIVHTVKTPVKDASGNTIGVLGIFWDITERKRAEEVRRSHERLQRILWGTIRVLASVVEAKDPYTAGHQERVTRLACAIAKEMGLSEEQIERLSMAGLVHDIGKISIPSEILSKPGKLSRAEMNLVKGHPQAGHEILAGIEFPHPVARMVLQHHERMDGSGYPGNLSGQDILLEARILAVADVVEAICSHRPYRPTLGMEMALDETSRGKGTHYDPNVVDACLKLFRVKGFKFE